VPHIPRHVGLLSIVSACLLAVGGLAYVYFGYSVFARNDIVVSQPPRIPLDDFFKARRSLGSTSAEAPTIGEPRSVKTIRVPGELLSMPTTTYDPPTSASPDYPGSLPPEFQLPSAMFQTASIFSELAFANRESKKPASSREQPASVSPDAAFIWPVRGRVVSAFGRDSRGHNNDGIKIAVPAGTSVKASEAGVISFAGNELKSYGQLVLVKHTNGYVTAYGHLGEILVKRDDRVRRGQVIAKTGQTGNVIAPQLHFEIRKGATPVNPSSLLVKAE
jgi:murein DD-endopeptidase MepM/ murein hydrolase activator NlpD